MRRPSGTALFLGGLGLLSTGGVLVGTALLTGEGYRSREVDPVSEAEPASVEPADTAATPGQRVPRDSSAASDPPRPGPRLRTGAEERPAAPMQSRPTWVGPVRADRVDADDYIVDGDTLRRAVQEVEEALSTVMPQLGGAVSGLPGMGLRVSSDEGAATLDSQGFTVTGLDLGAGFGLEVGDTIVSLNGHPIDGLPSAMRVFQQLFADRRDVTELRLEIYRRGARLYKTYPIVW